MTDGGTHASRSNAANSGQAPAPSHRVLSIPPAIASPSNQAEANINTLVSTLNNVVEGAQPDPAHGVLGVAQAALGTALGVAGLGGELADVGIAMAANAIFGNGVPLPALTIGALHIGSMHAHAHPPSLVPPAPPVPLPSLGQVSLATCASVLIGGMPAVRAGDMGVALTCGSLAPVFEVVTGSSNVFIGGARAGRIMDMSLHCNPIQAIQPKAVKAMVAMGAAGAALGAMGAATSAMDSSASAAEGNAAAAAGQAIAAATGAIQAGLDAAALAMSMLAGKDPGISPAVGMMLPMQGTVLIGGVPIPNTLEIAGELFKAAGRLASRVRGRLRGRRRRSDDDGNSSPHHTTCPA
jgi:uncharacterized Zn-binding protein involved in type VI secretion